MEKWKSLDFLGYPKYEISNQGNCRSTNANNTGLVYNLTPGYVDGGKYLKFTLCNASGPRDFRANRLVALTFIPNPYNLPHVDHKDDNTLDNRDTNLQWLTHTDNMAKRDTAKGSRNGSAKLTELEVAEIKKLLTQGISINKVASLFHVSAYPISQIKGNKAWIHVPWPIDKECAEDVKG